MKKVIRSYFSKHFPALSIDSHPYPCPRCRNGTISVEIAPMSGQMATCGKCGARGSLDSWNDGSFDLEKDKGKKSYHYCDTKTFERPKYESIEIVKEWELEDK